MPSLLPPELLFAYSKALGELIPALDNEKDASARAMLLAGELLNQALDGYNAVRPDHIDEGMFRQARDQLTSRYKESAKQTSFPQLSTDQRSSLHLSKLFDKAFSDYRGTATTYKSLSELLKALLAGVLDPKSLNDTQRQSMKAFLLFLKDALTDEYRKASKQLLH